MQRHSSHKQHVVQLVLSPWKVVAVKEAAPFGGVCMQVEVQEQPVLRCRCQGNQARCVDAWLVLSLWGPIQTVQIHPTPVAAVVALSHPIRIQNGHNFKHEPAAESASPGVAFPG
jgi:hypothetical protein